MPRVQIPEEVPVQRLPVYSRAEFDLHHWAGRLLIPKGQMITPDVVAALLEAKIEFLYTEICRRARPEDLQVIDIRSIQEAAPLPFAIFDRDGNLLAREGERLSAAQIDGLHRRGQKKIYYYRAGPAGQAARFEASYIACVRAHLDDLIVFGRRETRRKGIPISRFARVFSGRATPKPLAQAVERFYRAAVGQLEAMWKALAGGSYVRNAEILQLANDVLDRFLGDHELLAAAAFAQWDLPLFPEHSMATAVYALLAARRLSYNRAQARDLTVASLFHDIGYMLIPKQLLEAERALTKGERRIIFRHIEHALFLLARLDWPGDDLPIAIYQHRERGTGAGYPSGYRAERIHEYAAIVGAADVLHALMSDRPHRKAYAGSEAMNMVLKMAAMGLLDRRIVRILAEELSLYPIGATVTLSTGEVARVIAGSREPAYPWVGTIISADGRRLNTPKILDLSKLPALSISDETAPFEEPFAGF